MDARPLTSRCAVTLSLILAACSSPGTNEQKWPRIDDGAVRISVGSDPAIKVGEPYTKGKGAAVGATQTALAGAAGGIFAAAQYGVYAPIMLPYTIPIGAIVGAIAGGVVGAEGGLTEEELMAAKSALDQALADAFEDRSPGRRLADRLLVQSRQHKGYEFALMPDADTEFGESSSTSGAHLELAEVNLGLRAGGTFNRPVELLLTVRVVATPSERPEASMVREFVVRRGPHPFVDWAADDAALFRQALDETFDESAALIIYSLFTKYAERSRPGRTTVARPKTRAAQEPRIPVAGFAPVHPPVSVETFRRDKRSTEEEKTDFRIGTERIDAWPLILTWEPFPGTYRPHPLAPSAPFVNLPAEDVENVRYDIEIWKLGKSFAWFGDGWDYAWTLVYVRQDISTAYHVVDDKLCESCKYAWTVRARFELNGQTRVTAWSALSLPSTTISMFSGWSAGGDDGIWGGSHTGYHYNDLTDPFDTVPMPQVFYYPLEIQ